MVLVNNNTELKFSTVAEFDDFFSNFFAVQLSVIAKKVLMEIQGIIGRRGQMESLGALKNENCFWIINLISRTHTRTELG